MVEVLLQRKGKHLVAADPISQESVDGMRQGEVVACTMRRPRNVGHHRLFFALLNEVFVNQTRYATLDHLLDTIKIGVGHYDSYPLDDGRELVKPKSISFAIMDQSNFRQFYDRVIELICTRILPNTDSEQLKQRIEDIIGEPA